jgi:hypothetical protein
MSLNQRGDMQQHTAQHWVVKRSLDLSQFLSIYLQPQPKIILLGIEAATVCYQTVLRENCISFLFLVLYIGSFH